MRILAAQCHSVTMLDSIDYGLHRLYKGLFNIILHLIIKVLSAKEEKKVIQQGLKIAILKVALFHHFLYMENFRIFFLFDASSLPTQFFFEIFPSKFLNFKFLFIFMARVWLYHMIQFFFREFFLEFLSSFFF